MRLGSLGTFAIAACLLGPPASAKTATPATPAIPVSPDSSLLVIAGPEEPGTRLIVTGRVLRSNGRTPAPHERVGVYHTDASGQYGVHATRRSYPPNRDARLSGWLVTDDQGRFEIRTIRPGAYPGGSVPRHIHFIVGGVAVEMRFADDPILRRAGRLPAEGSSVQVCPVRSDAQGVEHASVEWRLR